jgi:hypothetical protein
MLSNKSTNPVPIFFSGQMTNKQEEKWKVYKYMKIGQ